MQTNQQMRRYAAVPNTLIDDTTMHYSAKIVYVVMALSQCKSGTVKLTVDALVKASKLCEATVLQAISELEAGGFIKRKRNWRFSEWIGCAVYASNTYRLRKDFAAGYTLISASILNRKIAPAAFNVLLYLYRCAGRSGRAFPSIRYIAGKWREKIGKGLDMAKSTVLRALKLLQRLQAFVKNPCNASVGDRSCNSYYMTAMVTGQVRPNVDASALRGGSIFLDTSCSKKITWGLTSRITIQCVREFGDLHEKQPQSELLHTDSQSADVFPCGGLKSAL